MERLRVFRAGTLIVTFLAAVADTSALTIVRNFTGGTVPGNAAGGGNLVGIFNFAADCWELAIGDSHTVTIGFSWGVQTGTTLAAHTLGTQGGTPNRETAGNIVFDNDGTSVWFMDATAGDNSEYGTFTEFTANLGGGLINVGRVFTDPLGLAVGRHDLFSVALHEIGHALGLSAANTSFQAENMDGDIDIMGPRPFPGTVIPTISGAHLNLSNALMFPSISAGIRRGQSAADILANAEISDFNEIDLDPKPSQVAAEPSSVLLFLIGGPLVAAAGWLRERRRR